MNQRLKKRWLSLRRIVAALERGEPELTAALAKHERGVKLLSICQRILEKAEHSVAILTGVDEQGNALTTMFDASATLTTASEPKSTPADPAEPPSARSTASARPRNEPSSGAAEPHLKIPRPTRTIPRSDRSGRPALKRRESCKMTANLLVMRDGRKLEVTEYGDRGGHPTFFFHGLIGSHHQASYIAAEAARVGIRIIAPNRPGVGRSEFVAQERPRNGRPTSKMSHRHWTSTSSA